MLERDYILAVLKKRTIETLSEVGDFEESSFDPSQAMIDLGASSLDVVEIVSRTMRELKVKVPPSRLGGVETVNQLVDLFFEIGNSIENKKAAS